MNVDYTHTSRHVTVSLQVSLCLSSLRIDFCKMNESLQLCWWHPDIIAGPAPAKVCPNLSLSIVFKLKWVNWPCFNGRRLYNIAAMHAIAGCFSLRNVMSWFHSHCPRLFWIAIAVAAVSPQTWRTGGTEKWLSWHDGTEKTRADNILKRKFENWH